MTDELKIYQGKTLRAEHIAGGYAELCFDREDFAINKLDRLAIGELAEAVRAIAVQPQARGVLVTSAKDSFIVGADITEFLGMFELSDEALQALLARAHQALNALEDLPVPSVAAINGVALGGGFELALATDLRVMSDTAQVGFPEVNLGLFPGFGGTVRMPRVATPRLAAEWITSGKPAKSAVALAAGVVDEVVPGEMLRQAALALMERAASGQRDWRARRALKCAPLRQAAPEAAAQIEAIANELDESAAQRHQPAPLAAVRLISRSIAEPREAALRLETVEFAKVARTQAASSMVQLFLSEQHIKRQAKELAGRARPVKRAAVLGAGIMGGGIAYASAARGVPVVMKDIHQKQLDLGMSEAHRLLTRHVRAGRMDQQRADALLASITPQLDYNGFDRPDIVVEAVVEKIEVKRAVLRGVEAIVRDDVVIASNTSSLRIDDLAASLARPENFVGMHFFNPAAVMPLVEIVRGAKTSETALAVVMAYAAAMGKTPIVVKDGPGFLVNRVLTAYMLAFLQLLREGVDFLEIDRAMEGFGWPMGPAYLNDVIGMDTGTHVFDVISAGFPDRLQRNKDADALRLMVDRGRLGQKSGQGFYEYESDPAGKLKKTVATDVTQLIASLQPAGKRAMPASEIVERMMLPLVAEAAWCLEEGVVGTPQELDMALVLGLGLPRHLGGALKYADWLGLGRVVQLCDGYCQLGRHYSIPDGLRARAARGERYYRT